MEDNCPHCGASLQGDAIPQEYIDKGFYAPETTHYSRRIGVNIQGVYDGTLYHACPDCGKVWPRFLEGHLGSLSAEYVGRHNDTVVAS